MEENSREEDIKNLNEIIELSKEEIDAKDENITAILDIEDLISLEHILSDYKRVLEINEVLLKENEELKANCIPIQKVKEKIRKNEEIIDISNDGDLIHELFQKNKVYEELLESEE